MKGKSTEYYQFDWDSNPGTDQGRLDFNHSVKFILQDILNLQDLFHMSLMFFIRSILQCWGAWSGHEIISIDQIGRYVLAGLILLHLVLGSMFIGMSWCS